MAADCLLRHTDCKRLTQKNILVHEYTLDENTHRFHPQLTFLGEEKEEPSCSVEQLEAYIVGDSNPCHDLGKIA